MQYKTLNATCIIIWAGVYGTSLAWRPRHDSPADSLSGEFRATHSFWEN